MTREEAIKILKAIRVYECYPKSASEETKEAIDMAIEALSAETSQDLAKPNKALKGSDLISRTDKELSKRIKALPSAKIIK